jgi:putative NADPH-quinone reductase
VSASKNILIVDGHPDSSPERLSSALAKAYRNGAEAAGHSVRQIDVGAMQFSPLRNATEFASRPTDDVIIEAQEEFLKANHIVFIFPLWLGGPPALLKAFLEQVARGQFLLRERKRGFPQGGLKGRSASVIVTMGMPPLLYRVIFGARGIRAFCQGILRLAGLSPVRTYYFGGAAITQPRCKELIQRVHELGRRQA